MSRWFRHLIRNSFFQVGAGLLIVMVLDLDDYPTPDLLILDPPRSGIHKNLVKSLPKFGSRRIVYVSCNPTTQARDIIQLIHWGWKLQSMTLVDMFPHTPHIETVSLLTK